MANNLKINANVAYKIIDGRAFLIFLDSNQEMSNILYIFNETGTQILELINNKDTIRMIEEKMYRRFDTHKEDIKVGVKNFVKELFNKRILISKK